MWNKKIKKLAKFEPLPYNAQQISQLLSYEGLYSNPVRNPYEPCSTKPGDFLGSWRCKNTE